MSTIEPAATECAPAAGSVVPPSAGSDAIVRATFSVKLAITKASPLIVTVVLAELVSAIVAEPSFDQLKKLYPSAAVAVICIGIPVLWVEVPAAGVVVPPSSGITAIVRSAVAGISAKFAVTVASPVKIAEVLEEFGFATVAFSVDVQLLNV